jgi:hypothetical protein
MVADCLPAKAHLVKALAASADAAYSGYASTRNVKMPVNTSNVLNKDGQLIFQRERRDIKGQVK